MIVVKQMNPNFIPRWNEARTGYANMDEQHIGMEFEGEFIDVSPQNQLFILDGEGRKTAVIPAGNWFMARKVVVDE